jgi:hypothetical protein
VVMHLALPSRAHRAVRQQACPSAPPWLRRSARLRVLHRKRVLEAGSTSLVNPISPGRVIPAVHLDCAADAIHIAGPHPVGKAMIRAGLLASLRPLRRSFSVHWSRVSPKQ